MTEPYIGQIEIFGFNFAPYNWALCAGQTIPLRQNTALYALLGISFGGNGTTTFQLPNLAARQACGSGSGPGLTQRRVGDSFGASSVTLDITQLPSHNHALNAFYPAEPSTMVETPSAGAGIGGPIQSGAIFAFAVPGAPAQLDPGFIQPAGGGQSHPNQQPFLGLNYSIALVGDFPQFP